MTYKPFEQRSTDTQYRDTLRHILEKGDMVKSQQGVDALRAIAPPPMHFKLSNGFPLITERSLKSFWRAPINELTSFIRGARTQEELEQSGCDWWKSWVTQEKCSKRGLKTGDLGPGSYGAAFHDFPTPDGSTFDQFENLVEEARANPHLRTLFVSPWIPFYIPRRPGRVQKVVVAPCHGWVHLFINDEKLSLHMFQRSADMPVGVPCNMVQYAALTMALASVLGYEPHEYIHSFSDAHIYVDQIPHVEKMLEREPRKLPTVTLTRYIDDIHQYSGDDFDLSDYHPHPGIKEIPVAT